MEVKGHKIIYKALVGSHSYGTNVEGSDEDFKGIYIQDPEDVLINGYREQWSIGKDETYYEIRRFIELCCTGNPTMLELLFTPEDCILYKHPVFDELLINRDKFISKSCRFSFGGYAISQIEKAGGLQKKMNWEKDKTERKDVLDFCYVLDPNSEFNSLPVREYLHKHNLKQEFCGLAVINHFRYTYNLFYDHVAEMASDNPKFSKVQLHYKGIVQDIEHSNDISLSDIPPYVIRETILYFNKDGYSQHCKDYKSYLEWLGKRNTQRYVDIENHGQKIDGKNLLHCVRLLDTALEIAKDKTIRVRRPNAEYLKEIRKGKHNLESLLESCRNKIKELDEAFQKSDLPDKADRSFLMELLVKVRKKFYDIQ